MKGRRGWGVQRMSRIWTDLDGTRNIPNGVTWSVSYDDGDIQDHVI